MAFSTPVDRLEAGCQRRVIVERPVDRLNHHMPVDAQDSGDQFAAKPVHHRHHDDQRGNAEHDANEGKPGNHRNERFLPP
jgi:hypothetical protein